MADFYESLLERLQDAEYRRAYGAELAKTEFALAVAEARHQQGWTQKELADRAGVSQAYIAKLESGEANPTIGHLGSILASIWMRPTVSADALISEREGTLVNKSA